LTVHPNISLAETPETLSEFSLLGADPKILSKEVLTLLPYLLSPSTLAKDVNLEEEVPSGFLFNSVLYFLGLG
jgi:hypothetical protein